MGLGVWGLGFIVVFMSFGFWALGVWGCRVFTVSGVLRGFGV